MKRTLIIVVAISAVVGLFLGLIISRQVSKSPNQTLVSSQEIEQESPLPPEIASLSLDHFFQGDEALASVRELHGKRITLKNGYIGHYQKGDTKAMLWIGIAKNDAQAKFLLNRMTQKIRKGTQGGKAVQGFFDFKETERGGKTIYSVLGQGQNHYFYQRSDKVIWLAVDASIAKKSLDEVIKKVK